MDSVQKCMNEQLYTGLRIECNIILVESELVASELVESELVELDLVELDLVD